MNQIITGIKLELPADSLPRQRASRQNIFLLERTTVVITYTSSLYSTTQHNTSRNPLLCTIFDRGFAIAKMARKIPLTLAQTRELAIRVAERRAKKHAKRTVTREARATGTAPILEGWAKNIQKGQYGQDIFDGKVHAKWPSMFKKHLGVLETHIKRYVPLVTR